MMPKSLSIQMWLYISSIGDDTLSKILTFINYILDFMSKFCKLSWNPSVESGSMEREGQTPLFSMFSLLLAVDLELKPVDLVICGFQLIQYSV